MKGLPRRSTQQRGRRIGDEGTWYAAKESFEAAQARTEAMPLLRPTAFQFVAFFRPARPLPGADDLGPEEVWAAGRSAKVALQPARYQCLRPTRRRDESRPLRPQAQHRSC